MRCIAGQNCNCFVHIPSAGPCVILSEHSMDPAVTELISWHLQPEASAHINHCSQRQYRKLAEKKRAVEPTGTHRCRSIYYLFKFGAALYSVSKVWAFERKGLLVPKKNMAHQPQPRNLLYDKKPIGSRMLSESLNWLVPQGVFCHSHI